MSITELFMDPEDRRSRRMFRFGLLITALFVVSLVQSCEELKLTVWGKTATGRITKMQSSTTVNDGAYITVSIENDRGKTDWVNITTRNLPTTASIGGDVEVIYLPNKIERAKLVADRSWTWPIIPAVFLLIFAVWLTRLMLLARQGILG